MVGSEEQRLGQFHDEGLGLKVVKLVAEDFSCLFFVEQVLFVDESYSIIATGFVDKLVEQVETFEASQSFPSTESACRTGAKSVESKHCRGVSCRKTR